jgi:hypothetical protein
LSHADWVGLVDLLQRFGCSHVVYADAEDINRRMCLAIIDCLQKALAYKPPRRKPSKREKPPEPPEHLKGKSWMPAEGRREAPVVPALTPPEKELCERIIAFIGKCGRAGMFRQRNRW